MVQLSPSFSLVSSAVCFSKSVFSVHSCWFIAVKLMFSLYCSDMIVLTADREETVTVGLTSYCLFALKVLQSRYRRIDLQCILRAMTTDTKMTQIIPKLAATRWSRVGHCTRAFFSFSTKNTKQRNSTQHNSLY